MYSPILKSRMFWLGPGSTVLLSFLRKLQFLRHFRSAKQFSIHEIWPCKKWKDSILNFKITITEKSIFQKSILELWWKWQVKFFNWHPYQTMLVLRQWERFLLKRETWIEVFLFLLVKFRQKDNRLKMVVIFNFLDTKNILSIKGSFLNSLNKKYS